ncbi:amino acid synthesis family protein [Rhodobacteraceae bacterium D3-12]|nr:amino acid synthesis family protein [Rhodobacteraceae bacterium D3-12]
MSELVVRKTIEGLEEIWHEGGAPVEVPYRRAWAMAVITNPFAGSYVPDIQPFMEELKPLGVQMAGRLIALLGGAENVEGYGKGAIVGSAGEVEHGALWHAPGGYAMRELLGADRSKAIVPSTKKVGGVGARLDVPVTHVTASYVRSHFDSIEVGCNDAPKADEMALILVMTNGARVHNRAGGLAAADITGEDGLR